MFSLGILQTMSDKHRFTCALVCKAWAKAATAATRNVKVWQPTVQKLNCLQQWLEKHGNQLVVLQLHECGGAALPALPCAQLQVLLLQGGCQRASTLNISSRVWGDIATATKLTSVALEGFNTESQQADVVSALTALPDLKQLTWCFVQCNGVQKLADSWLLQQLTKLTKLELQGVSAAALEHLGMITQLQYLSVEAAEGWMAAGCPGLGELKALTRFHLWLNEEDIPASVCQLTALQHLDVCHATQTALISLQALTGLTQLQVQRLEGLPLNSPPLQLPGLQRLGLCGWVPLPMSFLASCTALRSLYLSCVYLRGPGSLVASTMLQDLALTHCTLNAADGVAGGPVSWQQVLPGLGQLPHLTSLQLSGVQPGLQLADMEYVVACCSSLQVLHLARLQDSVAFALAQLSGLTRLEVWGADDEQCGALARLTGLRELKVGDASDVSAAGLRQLAALEQLTSLGFCNSWPSQVSRVLQQQMSDDAPYNVHAVVNQAPAGHPSDIPTRLLRVCDLVAADGG